VIEEQLPFPSGTATAQLINVLHRLPPPDTSIRRRRGYRELDTEAENEEVENVEATSPHAPGHDEERVMVEQDGWHTLIWSFTFAALVSVSTPLCSLEDTPHHDQLAAYFFPVLFAIPLFGGYLAKQWLWYFTPSLSYVGQGEPFV